MSEETPEKKPRTNYGYQGNSKKEREQGVPDDPEKDAEDKPKHKEEKVIRVVSATGKIKKPSIGKRFTETFFGEDIGSVGQYVMFEVLLPALKNTISEAISRGVDRAMFGNESPSRSSRSRSSYGSSSSRTNYSSYSSRREEERRPVSRRTRGEHEEVILPTKDDAEEVLDQLVDLIERFDVATLSDLKAMIGKTPGWTDEKNGWTDAEIKYAEIRRVREGWLLSLPPAEYID